MEFKDLRVKEILGITKVKTKNAKWTVKNLKHSTLQVKIQGKAIHDFGDRKMCVTDNCIYFLNQSEDHNIEIFEGKNDISSISVHFTTYEPIETPSFCIKLNSISEVISIFNKLEKYNALTGHGDNLTLSYFYRLCAVFEDFRQKKYAPRDKRMLKARDYIDLNFINDNCIDIAVEESGISRRRFNELFKNQFNITPNRYLTMRKVEYASQLLKASRTPISEISEMCGFRDIYYFSKVFKNETGSTPSKYRNKYN